MTLTMTVSLHMLDELNVLHKQSIFSKKMMARRAFCKDQRAPNDRNPGRSPLLELGVKT